MDILKLFKEQSLSDMFLFSFRSSPVVIAISQMEILKSFEISNSTNKTKVWFSLYCSKYTLSKNTSC